MTRLWKQNIHQVSPRLLLQQFWKQLEVSLNFQCSSACQATQHVTFQCHCGCEATIKVPPACHSARIFTHCRNFQFAFQLPVPKQALENDQKEGGVRAVVFKLSQEHTSALHSLSDMAWSPTAVSDSFWKGCGKGEPSCPQISFSLDTDEICGECCDWDLGIRWSPESFSFTGRQR